MGSTSGDFPRSVRREAVAIPFPGRGHVNPMLNFCKLLTSKLTDLHITFVVTEEWLELLISSEIDVPANIHVGTISNVIPSEMVRAADHHGFVEAALTKMEEPVERLIDRLDSPPLVIIYDLFLAWVTGVGIRRNIPVASFWPMSATMLSMLSHHHVLVQNGDLPVTNLSEQGENKVDYIPGVTSTRILDLPTPFYGRGQQTLPRAFEGISSAQKSQYLLFTSIYNLEQQVIDALRAEVTMPVYAIGPAIPYYKMDDHFSPTDNENVPDYIKWLDKKPENSVLYISQGSFLSVSSDQLEEIVAGVHGSGVNYLWVTRMEASKIIGGNDDKVMVVSWCDQLRVLCHPSVGGFWSHCGWNSTKEGIYAGVPMLTLPIMWDQIPNSKWIVEDWKIGWRVKPRAAVESLVTRDEVARLVQRFMDLKSDEGKEMRERVKAIKEISRRAIAKGGSADVAIDAFIRDITQSQKQ